MNVESRKNFLINFFFTIVVFALIYFAFKFLTIFLLPFLIGLIITVISKKPVDAISSKLHIKRNFVAVFFVVVVYTLVLSAIIALGYAIYIPIRNILQNYESYIAPITNVFNELNVKLSNILNIDSFNISDYVSVSGILSAAAEKFASYAASLASSVPAFIVSVLVTVVASCYIASDYTKIISFISNIFPSSWISKVVLIKNTLFNNIFKILRGYVIIMFITFCELCIGMWLFGVKNLFAVAGIICIVDILPILGVGTVLIPWAVILLITGDPIRGLCVALLYVVIAVVRNFIEPRIIGNQMGLHPLITLICMFVGLRLFGIIGMFAVPLSVMIIIELQRSGKFDIVYYFAKNFMSDHHTEQKIEQ